MWQRSSGEHQTMKWLTQTVDRHLELSVGSGIEDMVWNGIPFDQYQSELSI
jgi:hypothetical protein